MLQLSIENTKEPLYPYKLAYMPFAKKEALIMGSGNTVHNLRMIAWDKMNEPEYGKDWALQLNEQFFFKFLEAHSSQIFQQ